MQEEQRQQQELQGDQPFDDTADYFDGTSVSGETVISWEASEYIHHQKSTMWFMGFGLLIGALALSFFLLLNRDPTVLILVLVMAAALFKYATRKPNTLSYSLTEDGILAGEHDYLYSDFRSFSVMHDGGFYSIELAPLQRFKPALSIFFDEKDGEQIMDILSSVLPIEDSQPDFIDRILKMIRF